MEALLGIQGGLNYPKHELHPLPKGAGEIEIVYPVMDAENPYDTDPRAMLLELLTGQ